MPRVLLSTPSDSALKAVHEAIWQIEDELGLFEQQVGDTHFWRLVRWETCRVLAGQIERRRTDAEPPAGARSDRLRYEIAAISKRLSLPSWRAAGPVDTVLVPFPRKQKQNGVVADIHSKGVLEEPGFGRVLVLERTDAQRHSAGSDRIFVADRDRGRQEAIARALFSLPFFLAAFGPVHRSLDEAFRRRLGCGFPISLQSLALRTALFAENRRIFRRQLRATQAKRFIAAWQDQAMFAAAHDIGIESVELQHAAISLYNPHYHFPKRQVIPYFADRFLVFAPYWMECVTLPANTRASVLGSANMAMLRARPAPARRRRVMVPSQGPTYWPLLDRILEAAARAPDWEFVFRPHPREDMGSYVSRISSAGAPANFRLSPVEEDLYELIGTAQVQVGLASTALFEGMSLGCRTIILQSPMSAGMDLVLRGGDAILAETTDDILRGLEEAPAARRPEQYYAPPVAILDALRA